MAAFGGTQPHGLSVSLINDLLTGVLGKIHGMDTEDREYDNINDLWSNELGNEKKNATALKSMSTSASPAELSAAKGGAWYKDAFNYWEDEEKCPITDDGVLGGYGALTEADTRDSNVFIDLLKLNRPELRFDVVADCGAGIGRVTKNLLLPRFKNVHLIEQSPRLTEAAPAYLGEEAKGRITCFVQGLQDFQPPCATYDVIWIQWVIGHLHDLDFVNFFRRCATGLRPGGVIILKDNTTANCTFLVDKEDSSVARHAEYIRLLLRLAGLNIILEREQEGFPEELLPVTMFAIEAPPSVPPVS